MRDEEFIRAKVPMTKAEIRAIVLSKLELQKASVLYDIGAGTGSVSIEASFQIPDGVVYAVEQKGHAVELIQSNCEKFRTKNVSVIHGKAPEALIDLPKPTHAFIGGSSGTVKSVVELIREKNQEARFVVTAITMETLAQITGLVNQLKLDAEFLSVQVSKTHKVGAYHMMKGENPIYIVTFGGSRDE